MLIDLEIDDLDTLLSSLRHELAIADIMDATRNLGVTKDVHRELEPLIDKIEQRLKLPVDYVA